jgi:rhomboid protease GluP
MIGFVVEFELQSQFKYLMILLIGGIAGNLCSAWAKPYTISVGASSSIFAVLGALCIWVWLNFQRLGPFRY